MYVTNSSGPLDNLDRQTVGHKKILQSFIFAQLHFGQWSSLPRTFELLLMIGLVSTMVLTKRCFIFQLCKNGTALPCPANTYVKCNSTVSSFPFHSGCVLHPVCCGQSHLPTIHCISWWQIIVTLGWRLLQLSLILTSGVPAMVLVNWEELDRAGQGKLGQGSTEQKRTERNDLTELGTTQQGGAGWGKARRDRSYHRHD